MLLVGSSYTWIQGKFNLRLNGENLYQCHRHRYLGVFLDEANFNSTVKRFS